MLKNIFNNVPRVQEKHQLTDQQSCMFDFVAYLKIPGSNEGHQPRQDNSIPYMGILLEVTGRRKKLHKIKKASRYSHILVLLQFLISKLLFGKICLQCISFHIFRNNLHHYYLCSPLN